MLSTIIFFVITSVGIAVTGRSVIGKQLNSAMRDCDCICRPIHGTYPWILEDLRVSLNKTEKLHSYNWMMGPFVCLDPYESNVDNRINELQKIVDLGELTRLNSLGY